MNNYTENDWRLFKSKITIWQEKYITEFNKKYLSILQSDKLPSEKFWELEKRINADKHSVGVIVDMRRSKLIENIISLINDGVINLSDISEFSGGLKQTIEIYTTK